MLDFQWSDLPVIVESDSLEAVIMIKSSQTNRSKYAFLVAEIKESLRERNSCIFHICRSGNEASHFMADYGRLQGRTVVWIGFGLEGVMDIARRDL